MSFVYKADPVRGAEWARLFAARRPDLPFHIWPETGDPAALPRGAGVVNAGRGGHLVQQDLLQALEDGSVSAAILDVMEPEPPPAGHPFWTHPRIWLTPHVASMTQPETAVYMVIANLERHARGEGMIGLVDRARGY